MNSITHYTVIIQPLRGDSQFAQKSTHTFTNVTKEDAELLSEKLSDLRSIECKFKTSPLEALFLTTRTNSIKNLAKDFFFPTLLNSSSDNPIDSLKNGLLDIATLAFRVLTLAPRILYNYYRSEPLKLRNAANELERHQIKFDPQFEQFEITLIQNEGEELASALRQFESQPLTGGDMNEMQPRRNQKTKILAVKNFKVATSRFYERSSFHTHSNILSNQEMTIAQIYSNLFS